MANREGRYERAFDAAHSVRSDIAMCPSAVVFKVRQIAGLVTLYLAVDFGVLAAKKNVSTWEILKERGLPENRALLHIGQTAFSNGALCQR